MRKPVQRRLAAILAADVAGYSRLMGADEEGTLGRLKAHRHDLIDPKIEEHRGRIVKTTGDGMLVEFPSVVDAVRCAVEVQRAMLDRNAETPADERITFRIGVNLGDVIIDGDDIYGDGVNIAARLEALAEPSGICISRVVRDQIRDKLSYVFEDLGEQRVKNIARPVRVYAISAAAIASTPLVVAPAPLDRARHLRRLIIPASTIAVLCAAVAAWWVWPKGGLQTASVETPIASPQIPASVANTPVPRLSFVVLPFDNLSMDPEQQYFADGITDDLTTDLSRISGSFVIARNTAFTYKGRPTDAKRIGRELGVHYLIEGSVRRSGDQVQVNVQLIDTETGAHLWADRFDTKLTDLAVAQGEITAGLARSFNVELVEAGAVHVDREKDANPDVRDLAMRGWAWLFRPASLENCEQAKRAFERALQTDPQSVDARLGLALTLLTNIWNGWSRSEKQDLGRAEQLSVEVIGRDANNSQAHLLLGTVRRFSGNLTEAQAEYEAALALDRNNWFALRSLANTQLFLGYPEAAIPYIEKAMRLSPRDPQIAENYATLGACDLLLGHIDQAIDLLRRARAANPRLFYTHLWLAGALALRGHIDEAKALLAEAIELRPDINSLAAWREHSPWITNPRHWALRDKTLNVGLRRAGFPDE